MLVLIGLGMGFALARAIDYVLQQIVEAEDYRGNAE